MDAEHIEQSVRRLRDIAHGLHGMNVVDLYVHLRLSAALPDSAFAPAHKEATLDMFGAAYAAGRRIQAGADTLDGNKEAVVTTDTDLAVEFARLIPRR